MPEARTVSLAARVMLFVALAVGASLLLLGTVVERAIERHFVEMDAGGLRVVAQAVERVLQQDDDAPDRLSDALAHAGGGHHGTYFRVSDADGGTVFASPGADLGALLAAVEPLERIPADELFGWEEAGRHFRGSVVRVHAVSGLYDVAVAQQIDVHVHFLVEFRRTLWAIMALACALTLFAAWLGVRQGHAPLRELGRDIREIQSDRLQTRLDPDAVPVELRELVESFNQMIGQLEEGFERLSHFSADIAHELRTPLTNLITQTQVALGASRSADEYRSLLYSNLEEQERLARMVGDMLWLAKSERGLLAPQFAALSLAAEIRALFDFFEALAEESGIALALEGDDATVRGDRAMLRRALSNLLSNAIRHTPAGGTITVGIAPAAGGMARVEVRNPGPDIPAEHQLRIFDRFYRVDPARSGEREGSGLGLAIVRSIVEIHGGHIDVTSRGGLTTFGLELPLAEQG